MKSLREQGVGGQNVGAGKGRIHAALMRRGSIMPDSFDFSQPKARLGSGDSQPLLTYLLCGLSVLFTLAFFTSSDMPASLWYRIGHLGYPASSDIWDGRYYYLVTSIFNHGSVVHIVFNMLWLIQLGTILEMSLRPWQYALFLLGAAIVGSCGEMMLGEPGIGMSGVVYAMFGLLWAGRERDLSWRAVATRQNLKLFIGWGVLCIFLTYTHVMPIANGAHGAGFMFGLSVGWLFFAPRRRPVWGVALAALVAMCVLVLTYVPWSASWNFWKGSQSIRQGRYTQAIRFYERSRDQGLDAPACWHNIGVAWFRMAEAADKRGDQKQAQADETKAEAAFGQEDAAKQTDAKQQNEEADTPTTGDLHPRIPQPASTAAQPSTQEPAKQRSSEQGAGK